MMKMNVACNCADILWSKWSRNEALMRRQWLPKVQFFFSEEPKFSYYSVGSKFWLDLWKNTDTTSHWFWFWPCTLIEYLVTCALQHASLNFFFWKLGCKHWRIMLEEEVQVLQSCDYIETFQLSQTSLCSFGYGWCWFVMRDQYCCLAGDWCWFSMKEQKKNTVDWLFDKSNEHSV